MRPLSNTGANPPREWVAAISTGAAPELALGYQDPDSAFPGSGTGFSVSEGPWALLIHHVEATYQGRRSGQTQCPLQARLCLPFAARWVPECGPPHIPPAPVTILWLDNNPEIHTDAEEVAASKL